MRWNLLQSAPASDFATYSYHFTGMDTFKGSMQTQKVCTFTSTQAGDQLIAFLPHMSNQPLLRVQAECSSTTPNTIRTKLFGVFSLEFDTFQQDITPWISIKTDAGASTIAVPFAIMLGSGVSRASRTMWLYRVCLEVAL